jgi:hypothetical protein
LKEFPDGFKDQKYLQWERGYKEAASREWQAQLSEAEFRRLVKAGEFEEIVRRALKIESSTNLLFSFEKMALRDASRGMGSQPFAAGLFEYLHGAGDKKRRLEAFVKVLAELPRRQTRVVTWPVLTIFPFLANPKRDIYLKPTVTRAAARAYGFSLEYFPPPAWETYASVIAFAEHVRRDLRDLKPRDMIDIQSFLWVLGSEEYA